MIQIKAQRNGKLDLFISIAGPAVYLDNFAIKELAKGDPSRRQRFLAAMNRGGELLFSVANAAELTGFQGGSFSNVRSFLEEIGPRWFPVELNPHDVVTRELSGKKPDESCFSDKFMRDYMGYRAGNKPLEQNISTDFFRLGPIMDWLAPQRDSIARGKADLDEKLIKIIKEHRAKYDADPQWLDRAFRRLTADQAPRATFVYNNLIRTLILETKSYQLKRNDGIDFCHAVIASAFTSFATLDKSWKRRIDNLPKPNKLACIYYAQELDQMVDDINSSLDRIAFNRGLQLTTLVPQLQHVLLSRHERAYTPITPHNSFTAAALLSEPSLPFSAKLDLGNVPVLAEVGSNSERLLAYHRGPDQPNPEQQHSSS